jgi:hypothetical protein
MRNRYSGWDMLNYLLNRGLEFFGKTYWANEIGSDISG